MTVDFYEQRLIIIIIYISDKFDLQSDSELAKFTQ